MQKRYQKYPLVFATIVSFLSVCTAGVSTFAWFQAQANVNVRAAETSTTITVAAPDSFELGSPVMYAYSGNGSAGYNPTTNPASGNVTTPTNFVALTNENKSDWLNISGLVPGRRMTFCAEVSTDGGNINDASLLLTGYTSTNNNYRKVLATVADGGAGTQGTYPNNQDQIIRIEDTIIFYVSINTTGVFSLGDPDTLTAHTCAKDYTAGSGSQPTKYSNLDYKIGSATGLSASTIYVFYTIEFSNDQGTWYQEYTCSNNVYHKCYDVIANDYAGNRYFYKDSSHGSSSCYEGLSFTIDSMKISAI